MCAHTAALDRYAEHRNVSYCSYFYKHFANFGLKCITQCILQEYSKARIAFFPCFFMIAYSYLFSTVSIKNKFHEIISKYS